MICAPAAAAKNIKNAAAKTTNAHLATQTLPMRAETRHHLKTELESFVHKVYIAYSLYAKNELQNHAGAVAYFFLLSMIPVVVIFVLIFDSYLEAYPVFSEQFFTLLASFNSQLNRSLLEKIGIVNLSGGAIGVIGILNLLWISRLIMRAVQRAFSIIFPSGRSRHPLLDLTLSLIIVPFLFSLVALAVTTQLVLSFLVGIIAGDSTYRQFLVWIVTTLSQLLPFLIAFMIVYLSYRYLPLERPSTNAALQGSILCITAMFILKSLFARIFSAAALNLFYGFIGSLILALIWVYFVFTLFFMFAEYTYVAGKLDVLVLDKMFLQNQVGAAAPGRVEAYLFKSPARILEKYARPYHSGESIFQEGDSLQEIFFVYKGQVGVYKSINNKPKRLSTIKTGEVFGEMAYLLGEKRTATMIADDEAVLFVFPPNIFEELLKVNHILSRRTITVLCNRLHQMNPKSGAVSVVADDLIGLS